MAGRKNQPITVIRYLSTSGRDGPYKPWDECAEEEKQLFYNKTAEKVSKCLSDYYSARPEEYAALCKEYGEKHGIA